MDNIYPSGCIHYLWPLDICNLEMSELAQIPGMYNVKHKCQRAGWVMFIWPGLQLPSVEIALSQLEMPSVEGATNPFVNVLFLPAAFPDCWRGLRAFISFSPLDWFLRQIHLVEATNPTCVHQGWYCIIDPWKWLWCEVAKHACRLICVVIWAHTESHKKKHRNLCLY